MKIRRLTDYESIRFNIFIDKMRITNKLIYQTILTDFKESNMIIDEFIKSYN